MDLALYIGSRALPWIVRVAGILPRPPGRGR